MINLLHFVTIIISCLLVISTNGSSSSKTSSALQYDEQIKSVLGSEIIDLAVDIVDENITQAIRSRFIKDLIKIATNDKGLDLDDEIIELTKDIIAENISQKIRIRLVNSLLIDLSRKIPYPQAASSSDEVSKDRGKYMPGTPSASVSNKDDTTIFFNTWIEHLKELAQTENALNAEGLGRNRAHEEAELFIGRLIGTSTYDKSIKRVQQEISDESSKKDKNQSWLRDLENQLNRLKSNRDGAKIIIRNLILQRYSRCKTLENKFIFSITSESLKWGDPIFAHLPKRGGANTMNSSAIAKSWVQEITEQEKKTLVAKGGPLSLIKETDTVRIKSAFTAAEEILKDQSPMLLKIIDLLEKKMDALIQICKFLKTYAMQEAFTNDYVEAAARLNKEYEEMLD